MKPIIIDLGHDPKFQGANGVRNEVAWVRIIGTLLVGKLRAKGYDVTVVPDSLGGTDGNSNLVRKIRWINSRATPGAWLFSLHGDGALNPKARGLTVAYYGGSKSAEGWAGKLLAELKVATGLPAFGSGLLPDTQARFHRLGMIRDTKPMALLVENGFVSNPDDMRVDPMRFADGIANFITKNL